MWANASLCIHNTGIVSSTMLILLGGGNEGLSDNLCFMPLCEHMENTTAKRAHYTFNIQIKASRLSNMKKVDGTVKLL